MEQSAEVVLEYEDDTEIANIEQTNVDNFKCKNLKKNIIDNFIRKINIKLVIFTMIIWLFCYIFQAFYFVNPYTFSLKIAILNILHYFFLYGIIYYIFLLKNYKLKFQALISLIYFLVIFVLLLLTWPGMWSWDDIYIASNAKYFSLTPWQHFYSGIFHILCLKTLPFISGIIIIQSIIASLIVGYCINKIVLIFTQNEKQKKVLSICLFLIMLSPPLISYILSGFRMGIYSYCELLLIVEMISLFKEKKEVSTDKLVKICLLTIIISCWRTEAFYYPIFVFIFLIINSKYIKKLAIFLFLFVTVISVIFTHFLNNCLIGDNTYELTSSINTVVNLLRESNDDDIKEIEKIGKVIDLDKFNNNPNYSGEYYFWNGYIKEYSESDYDEYMNAYFKLALKYPKVVIKSIFQIFLESSLGIKYKDNETCRNNIESLQIFNEETRSGAIWNNVPKIFKNPINKSLREFVITLLLGSKNVKHTTIIYNIFWNLIIPIVFMFICLIYKLIRKNWTEIIIILAFFCRIILVMIASPAPYFMYYLSFYTCSYFISVVYLFELIVYIRKVKRKELYER